MTTAVPPTPSANQPTTRAFQLTVDRAALTTRAEGDERIPIAISSEHPVERYDWRENIVYLEVLDHAPSSVDLGRAARGLAFLKAHNSSDQFGKVEDITVDADRVMRGWVRFSRGPEAQVIKQDMLDDIRTDVSVGYATGDDYAQEQDASGRIVRRYTRWTPYEVSTVPIPADPTVGKGRAEGASHISTGQPAKERTMSEAAAPVNPANDASVARIATMERAAARKDAIMQIADAAGLSLADTNAYLQSDKSPDQVGRELLTSAHEKLRAQPTAVVLTGQEQRRYSFARLVKGLADGNRSGFEFEVSDEIAKRTGRPTNGGAYYPTTGSEGFSVAERTQLSIAAGAAKGPELKFVEYAGFADALRARMMLSRLGATFVNGLQGDFALTVQSAAGSFTWGTETANASLSSLSLAQRTGSPKVGQSATSFSRQLLRQSVEAIEPLVRNDLLAIHARGVETAGYNGSGTSSQPTGLLNTSGINLVAVGTNGGVPTYAHTVDMETEVATDNADIGSLAYVTTPGMRGVMKKTQQFSGTNGVPLWTGGIEGELNGYRAYATTLMPSTLTKGSSSGTCHAGAFGDWSSLYILEWGAAEIMVDPLTIGPALVKVTSYQLIDILVRHPEAFTVVKDWTTA